MIVKVNFRIEKPYAERLGIIENIIREEIERRKKVVSIDAYRNEKANRIIFSSELNDWVCYSCRRPIFFKDREVMFIESDNGSIQKTYFHLDCISKKFKYL
ncbi:MAG: hypothetical protein QW404_03015 [Candidatus Nanoarchaeia archaeon]